MSFINGRTEDTEIAHRSGLDDVVIKIRGRTAAKFLGRGEIEKQILAELTALRQRLESMEKAAAERAAQHETLSHAVEGLQGKVGQLSGQVADQVGEIRADLTRLRGDFEMHVARAGQVPGQVERAQMQVDYLQRQVSPLGTQLDTVQGKVGMLETQLGTEISNLGSDVTSLQGQLSSLGEKVRLVEERIDEPGWFEKQIGRWRQPGKPATDGETPANTSWLKQRLNNFW